MARQRKEIGTDESRILNGTAPPGLSVDALNFAGLSQPINLPENLIARSINLDGCKNLAHLPKGLRVQWLRVSRCPNLKTVPSDLVCTELHGVESGLREIPAGIKVDFRLDLSNCTDLRRLESSCGAKSIHLAGCVALEELPNDIDASFLTVSGCQSLERWPQTGRIAVGTLAMRDCPQFQSPPPWLGEISQLNLSGCVGLRKLPEDTVVTSWIDIAGTQLASLPAGCRKAALRWRGVYIDSRIAFDPDSIHADEVLKEENAERRRVLLERMGYSRFMEEAKAEVVDNDRDAGGERKLVRVPMHRDEDLVCVMVKCPSTARQYVIRVPPSMRSCRQAVAWIAGFDNENDYKPLAET